MTAILQPALACFHSDDELVSCLEVLNTAYRTGNPLVSDEHFDALFNELKSRQPSHPFVNQVQTTLVDSKGRIAHPFPMLSTEKAYEASEVKAWLLKVADFVGETLETGQTLIRLSPKFDGCAGRYAPSDVNMLVTRGDGQFGNDFSGLIGKGLRFVGDAANSVGEVICDEAYFQAHLKPNGVKHPRSHVAGLISADTLSPLAEKSLLDGAIHFVSYKDYVGNVVLPLREVLENLDQVEASLIASSPYRTDGIVLQVHSDALFQSMGFGSHSHFGQLAKKNMGEPVEAEVLGVTWQIGRTGRYTPVINIKETEMSGAMVSNVTGHHAGVVVKYGIGKGAVGLFVRAGEVIPSLLKILKPSNDVVIPTECQCCQSVLTWSGDFLYCENEACKARVASRIEYLAKMLGIDFIGGKAAEKLAAAGIDCQRFLSMNAQDLQAAGFGAGQAANIIGEINRVKNAPMDDYKLLASVGIHTLGRRASRNLLAVYPLDVLLFCVSAQDISAIAGFGDAKAGFISDGIDKNRDLLAFMVGFFADLKPSKVEVANDAKLVGKNVVFTGTLTSGSRNEIEKQAVQLGATVQSSVNKKTHFLICGDKVGATKIGKAQELGVVVITEAQYLDMIA